MCSLQRRLNGRISIKIEIYIHLLWNTILDKMIQTFFKYDILSNNTCHSTSSAFGFLSLLCVFLIYLARKCKKLYTLKKNTMNN